MRHEINTEVVSELPRLEPNTNLADDLSEIAEQVSEILSHVSSPQLWDKSEYATGFRYETVNFGPEMKYGIHITVFNADQIIADFIAENPADGEWNIIARQI